MGAPVVVLAGGTGGAKLARGLLDVCGDDLVAVVNTGDDLEIYGEIGARLKQGMIDGTMLKRIGEPEEVAAAIAFLGSDDASYVTGQTINVSGGLSVA